MKRMSCTYKQIKADDSVVDIIGHPAFSGFGQYIFPWDDTDYDADLKMDQVGYLLPYHSQINTDTVIKPLNHMIDDINAGKTVFHNFYKENEKQKEPSKNDTGLFFYRGDPGAPFAVICAGGGFAYVGSLHEGFPYALEISEKGYNAFVLKYRIGSGRAATEDLAAAISYIYENADALSVDTHRYSLWGSSAGARMVAYIGSYGVHGFGGDKIPGPGTVVMAYTGHTDYSPNDPPTFAIVGENDRIAVPSIMERRVNAMKAQGIDVEFHRY
ncbi:MAG: alpha/beta hydrolase, partial [Firmicutes bacterium]|nr:alpha/beta hydrolase [Bacillota bacterium]